MRSIPVSVHTHRVSRALAAALAVSIVAAPHGARAAAIVIGPRTTTQVVSFSDTAAFSDASVHNNSVLAISGNAGDSSVITWKVPDGATGFTVSVSGPFTVSTPVITSGTPNNTATFTVTATATPSSGTLTLSGTVGVNVAPSGADTTDSTGVAGGYNLLDVTFNPVASQSDGSSFTLTAQIPGNYSTAAVGTGGHQLISLNPNWTITSNFVFSGGNTIFSATISNYQQASDQIGLEYQIYGAPASEASGNGPLPLWALVALGAGLAGIVSLRLKRAK
jgi:hypothetical protein